MGIMAYTAETNVKQFTFARRYMWYAGIVYLRRRQMTPMGYGKSSLGTCFGVLFILAGVWLTIMTVKSGADISAAKTFLAGAVILAFLLCLMDLTNNLKNRKNIEHMHRMLEYPTVKGKIVEIKKYLFSFGRIEEVPMDHNRYKKRYVYRVVVSFYDEKNGSRKEIISPFYAQNPKRWTLSDRVDIHYSPYGEYWIEPDAK